MPNKLILSNVQVNGKVGVVKKKYHATKAITCKKRISTQRGLASKLEIAETSEVMH